MNMLIFPPLCLLLCWTLPVDSAPKDPHPLGMVEESVDDNYHGCDEAMMKIIKDKYLEKEKKDCEWDRIEKNCAERKFNERDDKALTKDHIQAICLYTAIKLNVYRELNGAVRTQRSDYGSSFKYHSLHYLLTSAIQILKNKDCYTTYRRTTMKFTGEVGQIIRFGMFASSSFRSDVTEYGNETCFQIKTCLGAFLDKYSFVYDYKKNTDPDKEVLIPPYEKFTIKEKMEGPVKIEGLKDCKGVFVLESAGNKSNLKCKVVNALLPKAKL